MAQRRFLSVGSSLQPHYLPPYNRLPFGTGTANRERLRLSLSQLGHACHWDWEGC